MKMKTIVLPSAILLASLCGLRAQILFSDNFDVDHSANWTVRTPAGNHAANVFFDYSTVGIPSAPNSGGSTRGVKLEANFSGGVNGGVCVFPTGQSFTGDYRIRFDLWQNFNGPAPDGGLGSTQLTGVGLLGSESVFQGTVNPSSIHFSATGEGETTADIRVYSSAVTGNGYAAASGVYAANSQSAEDPYYNVFGNVTAPAAQTALFPTNSIGTTEAGDLGWAWHNVVVEKNADVITWTIDGTLMATVSTNGLTLGGDNIFFFQRDINAGSSADPNVRNLLFGLVDNVVVEVVPEPSTYALMGIGGALLAGRAFRRKQK